MNLRLLSPSSYAVHPAAVARAVALASAAAVLALAPVNPAGAAEDDVVISVNGQTGTMAAVEGDTVTFAWEVSDAADRHMVTGSLLNTSQLMEVNANKSGTLDVTLTPSGERYATVGAYDAADAVLDMDRVTVLTAPRIEAVSTSCETVTFTSGASNFSGLVSDVSHTDGSGEAGVFDLPASTLDDVSSQTVSVAPGTLQWNASVTFADVDDPAEHGGTVEVEPCGATVVDPGTNVEVTSNACGTVTFTGVNSDSTISVTAGGETFDVAHQESVTISTGELTSLGYVATTQWASENWTEDGRVDVEPCVVKEEKPVKTDEATPTHPTRAPAAGR
ncbi:hypothetical protein [Nocardioides sp. AE5]|uniref:hypothetical protein n=1 Tax=Nocardioides sp. AE5 TaxID=2962573 RepID=UPI002882ACD9|nr:hypothetical protein [Nocardioides sp. AE5]MDT0200486.1 hypothetical protein [Nocardioides sp. AE5]